MVVIGIPLRYSKLKDGRCTLYLGERVRRTLQKAGAFILPIVQNQDVDYSNTRFSEFMNLSDSEKEEVDKYLDLVDGVFFPGGNKITPYDVYLLKRCIERKICVLGVCLGMQLMSCYLEDVKFEKIDTGVLHYQENDFELSHKVKIEKDSLLYKIIGKEEIDVNSFHNYHASSNHVYKTSATSEDGIIEGIELPGDVYNIGVQWHPEISYDFDDNSRKIIDSFIEACSNRSKS